MQNYGTICVKLNGRSGNWFYVNVVFRKLLGRSTINLQTVS